jgi:Tfp pilus assembly protein PilV
MGKNWRNMVTSQKTLKIDSPDGIRKPVDSEQGFTLLETSIALCVMMIVTLATGSLFVYAINYNSGAGDRAAALAIGQQRLERLRKSSFSDTAFTTGSTNAMVTSGGRQYAVVTTICATSDCGGSPSLKLLSVQVTPQGVTQWANAPVVVMSQRAAPSAGSYFAQ